MSQKIAKICYNIEEAIQKMFKPSLDFNIGDSVFLTQIISCRQKNADAKVHYRFNGICVGNLQKITFFQISN